MTGSHRAFDESSPTSATCTRNMTRENLQIRDLLVRDVRFQTSRTGDGSDALHTDPDYSATYVVLITTDASIRGYGLTFTIGRGNELVKHAVESLKFKICNKFVKDIQAKMGDFVRDLCNDSQLRWVGPEKGVVALAAAAIINAFWDMWGRMEKKPVWKLLVDMDPETIVSLINFDYISDCISREEALRLLEKSLPDKSHREEQLRREGYPAYTTQVGWMCHSPEQIRRLCNAFKARGFKAFKIKVGTDVARDRERLRAMREAIGDDCIIMTDANQKWGVHEAIDYMKQLACYRVLWIEEPTSPDDVLGHKAISDSLRDLGIGIATGEMCQNRVMFKQFLQSGAMQFCQVDAARMAGLNDALAVYLMAAKLKVPVCPHAGGVGLTNMVQHLQMFDYVCLTGSAESRWIEFIDHLQEHFKNSPVMKGSRYFPPTDSGYSTEMWEDSVDKHEFPNGDVWRCL